MEELMKRLNEYTDAELLELEQAGDIELLVDQECAHEGIPLLPTLPLLKKKEVHQDQRVYKIAGLYFESMKDAQKVLNLLKTMPLLKTTYAPGSNYSTLIVSPLEPNDYNWPKIEQEMHFSEERWGEVKKAVASQEEAKKAYEEAKKEYDRIEESRQTIRDEITERITAFQNYLFRRDQAHELFQRYLRLAENDAKIAGNFMSHANNTLWEEFEEELIHTSCGRVD